LPDQGLMRALVTPEPDFRGWGCRVCTEYSTKAMRARR